MKGFFSFIILFALVLLIIQSSSYFSDSDSFSTDKLIYIERIYQLEMNLKESIEEGAREGAIEGFSLYLLSTPANEFNVDDAEQYVRISVHEKLSSLNSVSLEDFDFSLWCGDPSKKSINNLRKKMLLDDELSTCSNCKLVENLNCVDSIHPDFSLEIEPGELPEFSSLTLGDEEVQFGVSIYSSKFKISSVFLISKEKVILID